jgi:hypothetical protein
MSDMAAGYRRATRGTARRGCEVLEPRDHIAVEMRHERRPRRPGWGYGGRMFAASYAIAAILLLGATVLAAGLLAGLLLAIKAMDKGPGDH